MKKIITFAIIVIALFVLNSCCGPQKTYKHTAIVEVVYTDGTKEDITLIKDSKMDRSEVVMDVESGCAILRMANGRRFVVSCDVRRATTKSLTIKEIVTKKKASVDKPKAKKRIKKQ